MIADDFRPHADRIIACRQQESLFVDMLFDDLREISLRAFMPNVKTGRVIVSRISTEGASSAFKTATPDSSRCSRIRRLAWR